MTPKSMKKCHQLLMSNWLEELLSVHSLRVDSTVPKSNIPIPRDSQLLYDGVRVLGRLML